MNLIEHLHVSVAHWWTGGAPRGQMILPGWMRAEGRKQLNMTFGSRASHDRAICRDWWGAAATHGLPVYCHCICIHCTNTHKHVLVAVMSCHQSVCRESATQYDFSLSTITCFCLLSREVDSPSHPTLMEMLCVKLPNRQAS